MGLNINSQEHKKVATMTHFAELCESVNHGKCGHANVFLPFLIKFTRNSKLGTSALRKSANWDYGNLKTTSGANRFLVVLFSQEGISFLSFLGRFVYMNKMERKVGRNYKASKRRTKIQPLDLVNDLGCTSKDLLLKILRISNRPPSANLKLPKKLIVGNGNPIKSLL